MFDFSGKIWFWIPGIPGIPLIPGFYPGCVRVLGCAGLVTDTTIALLLYHSSKWVNSMLE